MKINGSKPGEVNYTPPYSTGLLRPPHAKRFGLTTSLFMSFENMVTDGEGTDGFVLGGKPVFDEDFAGGFKAHPKAIAATRRKLERWGYIETKRARGGGYTTVVKKSKKWELLKRLRGNESAPVGSELTPNRSGFTPNRSELALAEGSLPIDDKVVISKGQGRSKPAARVSHPLHHEIRTWCAGEWEKRFKEKPPWGGRDNKALKDLLQALPDLTLARIQQVWANFMESTKKFYNDTGWPLWVFCQDFAGLSLHSVHDRGRNHGQARAGKPNGSGGADPLARFRGVERKASEFANRTH